MKRQSGSPDELLSVSIAGSVVVTGGLTDTELRATPVTVTSGFGIGIYDYVSLTQASTTDTYVFKTGGSGGTTVATIVITYTDSTKEVISNIVKT